MRAHASLAALVVAFAAAGCNVVFGFKDINPVGAGVDAPADSGGPGQTPLVYSSPGPLRIASGYQYAIATTVTLAADDPATTIYYTTDGTTPALSSTHAMTPVKGIAIAASETLSYFGANVAGDGAITSDAYYVDGTQKSSSGYVATGTLLDGTSPVVVAKPGQVYATAKAHVQIWVQSSCPACATQLVYGVDETDQGCLFDSARDAPSGPGVYPGLTRDATFTLTAPLTAGIHEVRVVQAEQYTCADAMAMSSLKTRPDIARIGVLIVR